MTFKSEKHFRYEGFDYSADGFYFVTICTDQRKLFFGKVENEQLKLSTLGEIAKKCWLEIPKYYPFVQLDQFVIMPNHVHGIIIIERGAGNQDDAFYEKYKNKFGPQSGNLSSIVRGFKIGVTKNAKEISSNFSWQPRFHDRIIRNLVELNKIKQYIMDNPSKWFYDRNNPDNIKPTGTQGIAFLRDDLNYL